MSALGILRRRAGKSTVTPEAAPDELKGESVDSSDPELQPLTELLMRARTMGRPSRQTEYLHVSDLLSKCLRRFALLEKMQVPLTSAGLSLAQSLTFAQGDAIHETVKHRVAISHPTLMWGNWRCMCGKSRTTTPMPLAHAPTTPCPACEQRMSIYVEVPMRHEQLKIVGTPDLLTLLTAIDALHISELKSITHEAWKELARPDPDHVIQVIFYWYLMKELGYRIHSKVSILYVTKGHVFKGVPWKEFVIDASSQVGRLAPYLKEAAAIRAFRAGGALPDRVCKSADATQAKNCEVCVACFGANNAAPVEINLSSALASHPRQTPIRTRR